MFQLVVISDSISIPAEKYSSTRSTFIEKILQQKYCNRVIPDYGLSICLHRILEIGDEEITSTGEQSLLTVKFSIILFLPFLNQVIEGFIIDSLPHGIVVSLGFFQSVWIPKHNLFPGSTWNEEEEIFVSNSQSSSLEYQIGSVVRFQVERIHFNLSSEIIIQSKIDKDLDKRQIITPLSQEIPKPIVTEEESTRKTFEIQYSEQDQQIVNKYTFHKHTYQQRFDRLQYPTADGPLLQLSLNEQQGLQKLDVSCTSLKVDSNVTSNGHSSNKSSPDIFKLLVIGSMQTSGLGPRGWWHENPDDESEDESEDEENSTSNHSNSLGDMIIVNQNDEYESD